MPWHGWRQARPLPLPDALAVFATMLDDGIEIHAVYRPVGRRAARAVLSRRCPPARRRARPPACRGGPCARRGVRRAHPPAGRTDRQHPGPAGAARLRAGPAGPFGCTGGSSTRCRRADAADGRSIGSSSTAHGWTAEVRPRLDHRAQSGVARASGCTGSSPRCSTPGWRVGSRGTGVRWRARPTLPRVTCGSAGAGPGPLAAFGRRAEHRHRVRRGRRLGGPVSATAGFRGRC